jgi:O-antigen ligase
MRMGDRAAATVIALTLFLAPALGATTDILLQDTLKSAIVCIGTLAAALIFFWNREAPARWHLALALPLSLAAYALGSMAWSHPWLAGVEAVRWFIVSLLMFLALNVGSRGLAWGIVAGGAVASLWAVLQFLFGFEVFPQGAAPASTFINRNFFAEFAVCTLPFVGLLVVRGKNVVLLSCIAALEIAALCMAGTRSALVALGILVVASFAWLPWRTNLTIIALAAGIGLVPGTDGITALDRAASRAASIEPADSSLAIRYGMWRATAHMIAGHPLAGVGAGAWENEIPWYQPPDEPVETDFYAHNEFLQLVAEYGVAGWAFLACLIAWVVRVAWRAWRGVDAEDRAWRATLLASVLSLFIVSSVGFAWHLAATAAMFAFCLGALAATEPRHEWRVPRTAFVAVAVCSAGAIFITWRAVECERKLIGAAKLALSNPVDKRPMLAMVAEGIAINPHYRKVTPMVADQLARQGDWEDAIWIWESVLSSRPNVVAILTNTARGYIATKRPQQALPYIERARRIQPDAPSVRSAEVLLLVSVGRKAEALEKAREALSHGIVDADLEQAVKVLQMSASSG